MIRYRGFTKTYGGRRAVDALTLEVPAGAVVALLGPNGSGKTTSIKAAAGLVRPDAGDVVLGSEGLNALDARARKTCAFLPQRVAFPEALTGREVVEMLRDLRGRGAATDEELLDWFGESGALDRPVRVLSGGTRQKLNAAIAFLFRPTLIILDEPTAGLDPVASGILKDKIRRVRDGGATVVLSSHLMAELEELAEDLVFLVDGRVRYAGSIEGLKERAGETGLERAMAALLRRGSA